MVRKENMQVNGNSLLMTATSKRFGPGRFASLVARGTAKPPVKKVKFTSSDASRVSEMTASVLEEPRTALVKEVKVEDIDVESSILEMSMASGNSSYYGKERSLLGNEKVLTPQPCAYQPPAKKEGIPMQKKEVSIQKGITFTAPSPMSLDRVQVQMGQERTAPPSEEWKKEDAERKKIEIAQREKKEFRQSTKDAAKKFNEEMRQEIGEGFEMHLDDAEFETAPTKKSLMKKFLKKIRPKKPMTEDRAREMAREAMHKSKSVKSDLRANLPLDKLQVIPVEEITMVDHEESLSDLDSIGKKNFPVKEVMMEGEDARDDSSMSTLGTQHFLERMGPGPLITRQFHKDNRDPTSTDDFDAMGRQQMFHPKGTPALIDRIDSGNLTEDVHQRATTVPRASTTALGMLAAAMCMVPGMGNTSRKVAKENNDKDMDGDVIDAALAHIKKGIADDSDYLGTNLRKTLSPIEEGEDISPRNCRIPGDAKNPMHTQNRRVSKRKDQPNSRSSEGSEVIDLTNLASPISPSTQDGIKGAIFSFDDIMDVAASKLTNSKVGDRYAVEDATSPRKAITPKASGGQNNDVTSRQLNSTPSWQVSKTERGQESVGRDRITVPGQISPQSSFEVYEHPEGDIVMWSENPVQEEKGTAAPKEFNGNFSDGLFDLLSTDESVSRGRKKVPFLTENQGTSLDDTNESTDEVEEANACMFDLTLGACGRVKDPPIQRSINEGLNSISARVTTQHGLAAGTISDDYSEEGKINPNVGVMCGAVPLYFMYRNRDNGADKRNASDPTKAKSVDYIKIQDDLVAKAAKESTPESYQDRVLPVGLPEKEEDLGSVDDSNKDFVISLPQNIAPATSNILLARDDAYWDTLSTIASTKDKSAGSVNVVVNEETKPGPIPVEITMKNKPPLSAIMKNESQMTQTIGKLSNLMVDDDDSSAESLSKQLAAITMEKNESNTSPGSERVENHQSDSIDLGKSKNESLRLEKSMNEPVLDRNRDEPGTHTSKEPPQAGTPGDASELLLTVTRSDGNDEARMALPVTKSDGNNDAQKASPGQAPLSPSNGWQVRGMSKPFRISQEALQDASSGLRSYVPKSPDSSNHTQVYSSLNVHSKRNAVFTSLTTSVHKPDPLAPSMSNNAFANPWKNSNRSVSWGVEEIYEASSPTSITGIDAPQGTSQGTSNDEIMLARAEGVASQLLSQQKALSPISVTTQSPSTNSSSQLSARDEQELISRTLMLSKQLLSSMAIQELGGADNDFMKSLMSFGTEDGKMSLQSPESKTAGSTDVRSLADSSTSSPPREAVQGDSGRMRPRTPNSIRHLGPAPTLVREAIDSASGTSADPPEASDFILPSASGRSEDSPIDVDELFSKYDNLANDLIGENAKLQGKVNVGPNDENNTASSNSPKTMSRLDQLRAHRTQAMAKLQVGTTDRQFGNRASVDVNQRKDRVSSYSQRSLVNPRVYEVAFGPPPVPVPRAAPKEDDLETTSTRSASSTPSMKARELRRQLDEAIQASRNIKESQDQLGSELEHFKTRFYRKNDALEDQAIRAIGGL